MIKNFIKVWKEYCSIGVNNYKYLIPLFISTMLRHIFALSFPLFLSLIVGSVSNEMYSSALIYVVCLAIVYILHVAVWHWNYVVYSKNANDVYLRVQKKIIGKIAEYDDNFTKSISKAEIINTVSQDLIHIRMFFDVAFDTLAKILSIVISLVILLSINVYVGVIALVFNLIYFKSFEYTRKKKIHHLFGQRKHQDRIIDLYSQALEGNKEIKTFNLETKIKDYLEVHKRNWTNSYFKKRKYLNICWAVLPALLGVGKYVVYIIFIIQIGKGTSTVAELVLVIGYFESFESSNNTFLELYDDYSNMEVRVNRINSLINYSNKNILEFGENSKDNIEGIIDFKHVTFEYEKQTILKDISFHINSKSLTAIVGKSGSGKSTIFRLLIRLYKLEQGAVLIDGINIYDYSKETYPSNVSIATQKPFIFNMSIRDNLGLVDPSHKNQEKACRRVGIHNFIMSLPKGYNTILKEDATDISGGQKQLISLARTLLSKSEILLFDEVTSALDPNTSKQITRVLKDLKKDHTILLITHSPQLMKIVDDIIVISKGQIVGRGSHRKLKNNRYYTSLQK